MCDECATTLLIMYKFRVKAQEAQRILALQELETHSSAGGGSTRSTFDSFDSLLPTPSSCTPTTSSGTPDEADDAMFNLNDSFDINTAELLQSYDPLTDLEESLSTSGVLTPPSTAPTEDRSTENSGDDEIINYVLPIVKSIKSEPSEPQAVRLKRKGRRSVKETPINYKCKQCGAGFFILKNLVNHLKVQHAIQEKYSCHGCNMAFTK